MNKLSEDLHKYRGMFSVMPALNTDSLERMIKKAEALEKELANDIIFRVINNSELLKINQALEKQVKELEDDRLKIMQTVKPYIKTIAKMEKRIKELEEEAIKWKDKWEFQDGAIGSYQDEIYSMAQKLKELENYVAHIPECRGLTGICTCGLNNLLNPKK